MLRLLVAGWVLLSPLNAKERGVWLCVGPDDLMTELKPLCELRAGQGWQVECSSAAPAEAIAEHRPAAVLLLGDDTTAREGFPSQVRAERRPYHGWKATHPEVFVTDSAFGDLDRDGVPDIPVGRIPARTPAEAAAVVKKILAWESRVPSPADLTIPVWAGDPGFGNIGEVMTRLSLPFFMKRLRSEAPPWAGFWLLHSEPRSPFCGWPEDSAATFNRRIADGALFSAMIGHGRTDSWWIMTLPEGALRYGAADARSLVQAQPSPPHVLFACKCGDFADPAKRCLAEELVFAPGGPVACVAASVDSHPLTNYYGSTSLLHHLAGKPAATFGEAWLRSIRDAHARRDPVKEWLVSALEPLVIGTRNPVKDLKADHLLIYNLMGDPATRLFLPDPLEATVKRTAGGWSWSVPKPADLPPGAKLLIQHRAPLPAFGLGAPAHSRSAGVKLLGDANATLDFRTLQELGSDAPWTGTMAEVGTLRLCVVGSPALQVHAVVLGGG
jgi:hypothetical protein